MQATVGPEDATDKTLSWTSSDPSVAKIEEGEITALKLGTAEITAKAGDKAASCRVTVEPTPVASVTLDLTSVRLYIGEVVISSQSCAVRCKLDREFRDSLTVGGPVGTGIHSIEVFW